MTATEIVEVAEVALTTEPAGLTGGPRGAADRAGEPRWPGSGPRCSAWPRSASRTTSSPSAATRWSPSSSIAQIRKATGVRLPMQTLFEQPTVAGLAAHVEELRGAGASPPAEPAPQETTIPKLERRGETP